MPTVGGNQVSSFSTPTNGTSADADVVRSNDNTTRAAHNTHDADATIHVQSSVVASRPAAGTAGRVWLATDSDVPRIWYDNGTTWVEIDYLNKTQGGTVSAATTFSAAVTTSSTLTPSGGIAGDLILNDAASQIRGGATSVAVRNNADTADNVLILDAGTVTVRGELRVSDDVGGAVAKVALTNFDDTGSVNGSGTGTIKFKDVTDRDSAGFLKVYVGTTAYYVPYFAAGG